ncbi:hypothetical protein V3C99_013383, partial [Haemonchus contortus]
HGIVILLLATTVSTQYPTLRDLINPQEQYALRDVLSTLVEGEYHDNVIGSDEASIPPKRTYRIPSIAQLNKNYSDLLFQGDIRLPTSLLSQIVAGANTRQRRTAFRNGNYPMVIWDKGVPFAFHRSLKPAGRRAVLASIQFFRHHTCIRFRRRKREPVYLLFTGHDEGCWSTVGRAAWQGQQLISIGPGCEPFGVSSHEVAHALGLFHEQSRFDRDNWITVYPQRVPRSLLYNYAKVGRGQMATYGTAYDIGSVMHYTPFEFSKDPNVPSMVAKNINEQANMGQLAGPSFHDIFLLNKHYKCLGRCKKRIKCFNGGYQNPRNCRICKCPLGYGGRFCGSMQGPSIPRCGRKLYATEKPKRIRVKIVAAPRAAKPRTCVFHVIAPENTRVHLTVESVTATCLPGCWREAAEFKVRADRRITGNRFCCTSTSGKSVLSNTRVVPFILKAIKKTAEITFQFRFQRKTPSRDGVDENGNGESENVIFGTPERIIEDQFEIEIQSPLQEGETPPAEVEKPARDGGSPAEEFEDFTSLTDELPELDPDLEAMVYDEDVVEIDPLS